MHVCSALTRLTISDWEDETVKSKKRFGSLALVCAVLCGIVGAWSAGPASSRTSSTLVVAATTAPDTLDPQKSSLNQTWPDWQLSYECLLRATSTGALAPSLATSYTENAAGTVYTFTLRKGVHFQNGELLTPSDVVYTFTRLHESGIPYAQGRFPTLQTVKALSSNRVQFVLSAPQPGFLLNMGDPFGVACAILSKKAGASTNLALKMVGTGPFTMVSYSPNRQLVMKRFDGYWGKKAGVANLTILYTPDTESQLVALSSGKVGLIFPDPSIVKPLQGSNQIKLGSVISATSLRVEMSAAPGPLSNPDVRRAVELAVDKRAAVNGAYLGYGAPATYLPQAYKWAPAAKTYAYGGAHDVARAKQLLAGAGYPHGFSTNYLYIAGFSPASDRFAQILQSQLAEVGIKLTLDGVDTPTYLAKLGAANYGLAFNQYPYFSDPSLYVSPRANRNGPTPPQIQQLVTAMTSAKTSAQYLKAISALAVAEDANAYPNFVVASPTQFVAYRRATVHNVKIDFTAGWSFLAGVTVSS